jgi:tRNA modification GTPase
LDKPPPRVMIEDYSVTEISCMTCEGLDIVREKILARINERMPDLTSGVVVTSARHQQKLSAAKDAAQRAAELARKGESPEVLALELRQAVEAIDEITGRVYTEDILGEIFGKFCIGK